MITKQSIQAIKKKNWTLDQYKESYYVPDRTAWYINMLSPHNLWNGVEAIERLIEEAEQRGRDSILAEVEEKVRALKPDFIPVATSKAEQEDIDLIEAHNDALNEVLEVLSTLRKGKQ